MIALHGADLDCGSAIRGSESVRQKRDALWDGLMTAYGGASGRKAYGRGSLPRSSLSPAAARSLRLYRIHPSLAAAYGEYVSFTSGVIDAVRGIFSPRE